MAVDDSYTKALLHFNGTNNSTTMTDESGKTWTAQSGAKLSTTTPKFGTASLLLNGTTDYIDTGNSTDFDLTTGNFTIDMWIRFPNALANNRYMSVTQKVATTDQGWQYNLIADTGGAVNMRFANYNGSGYNIDLSVAFGAYSTNTWYHIAVVRSGNSFYFFRDGTQIGTTQTSAESCTVVTGNTRIGANRIGANSVEGYIDEYRFSNGIARWTTNFTPPTSPYPVTALGGFLLNFL